LPKNATKEVKDEKMMSLLQVVEAEIKPVIDTCLELDESLVKKMPWNQKRTINQIKESALQYLQDVRAFLMEGCMVSTKRLSFHLKEVVCWYPVTIAG
jgi:hypothetical protein